MTVRYTYSQNEIWNFFVIRILWLLPMCLVEDGNKLQRGHSENVGDEGKTRNTVFSKPMERRGFWQVAVDVVVGFVGRCRKLPGFCKWIGSFNNERSICVKEEKENEVDKGKANKKHWAEHKVFR